MKKIIPIIVLLGCCCFAFSQEVTDTTNEETVITTEIIPLTEKVEDGGPFLFVFDEGASYAQVSRIEKQSGRSNFVRETMLAGAFFNFRTVNLAKFDFIQQISAYYPCKYTFNGMQQFPKNMLNYAVDSFTGAYITYDKFNGVNFTGAIGMHYMFQLTDEWPMSYLGLGLQGGIEFPVSEGWTIVTNAFFSYDNANIGPNKLMQPFTASYQYHIDFGFRYSRRVANSYCYVKPKSL